mmetsp:Transcript_13131/g.36992  ORF Transcript_13131/g.36992 Transcript_13131/m.36992 type:complete len:199 (+) Transcript_13131:770-1366(+)
MQQGCEPTVLPQVRFMDRDPLPGIRPVQANDSRGHQVHRTTTLEAWVHVHANAEQWQQQRGMGACTADADQCSNIRVTRTQSRGIYTWKMCDVTPPATPTNGSATLSLELFWEVTGCRVLIALPLTPWTATPPTACTAIPPTVCTALPLTACTATPPDACEAPPPNACTATPPNACTALPLTACTATPPTASTATASA